MRFGPILTLLFFSMLNLRVHAMPGEVRIYHIDKKILMTGQAGEISFNDGAPKAVNSIFELKPGQILATNDANEFKVRALDGKEYTLKIKALEFAHNNLTQLNAHGSYADRPPLTIATQSQKGAKVPFPFSEKLESLNGRAIEKNAADVVENVSGKADIQILQSEIIDVGTPGNPDYNLVHQITFNEHGKFLGRKGWTTGAFVKQDNTNDQPTSDASMQLNVVYLKPQSFDDYYPAAPIRRPEPRKPCPQDLLPPLDEFRAITTRLPLSQSDGHEAIGRKIGLCALNLLPTNYSELTGKNIYDEVALKKVLRNFPSGEAARIRKDNGSAVTAQDFVDIDVLARTLYGEMGNNRCGVRSGTKYMEAVAKVILNRVEDAHTSRELASTPLFSNHVIPYIGGPQSKERKGDISKVALAKTQFSMWNDLRHQNNSTTLNRVLCPPRPQDNTREQIAWNNAVAVAMSAVLHPNQFAANNSGVRQRYYTSDMPMTSNRFWNFNQASAPRVASGTLGDDVCMMFWNKTPKSPSEIKKSHRWTK